MDALEFFRRALNGNQVEDVLVDSEVSYIMFEDGTQVTIKGFWMVQPAGTVR